MRTTAFLPNLDFAHNVRVFGATELAATLLVVALAGPLAGSAARAQEAGAAPAAAASTAATSATATSQVLLEARTHGDGAPLVYPKGTPLITARITTIPPGVAIPKHRHLVPLAVYILEGELSLYGDDGSVRRFGVGQAFMESSGWHYGKNEGTTPVRLYAVYAGEEGVPLSVRPNP